MVDQPSDPDPDPDYETLGDDPMSIARGDFVRHENDIYCTNPGRVGSEPFRGIAVVRWLSGVAEDVQVEKLRPLPPEAQQKYADMGVSE